jgi:hypothetical protein
MAIRKMTIIKTIVILLLASFVAWVLFFCWIHLSYASNLPGAPDEKTGHVYRMVVNHGFVRYGTEQELQALRWAENSQIIAIASLVVAIILGVKFDVFKKRAVGGDMGSVGEQKSTTPDPHKGGSPDN